MAYTFKAYGHKNILATHRNTLEFTKDAELSLDGDCIVGVRAGFETVKLKDMVRRHKRLRMRISAGGLSDEIEFKANPEFRSDREVVLRFSEFSSDRTLGFRASKSSKQLDRKLVKMLRQDGQKITVTIEPLYKAVLFDFDDTLEDYNIAKVAATRRLAGRIFELYGIFEPTSAQLLDDVDKKLSVKGMHSSPGMFDRHLWFSEFFKKAGVKVTKKEIDDLVILHWRYIIEEVRPMPHALQVLRKLKKSYKLAVMSDSDGNKKLKMERIKVTGMQDIFDIVLTSDDTGENKPSRKFYDKILERFGVKASECVMVGDKPQVDLKLAHSLGMKTVWVRHGDWARRNGGMKFDYVDHEIDDLKDLPGIIEGI
ncbi:HAD-IA family hydrolase [Candidatus Woesearchaeota archaeon]|nr:HAD-IA family hydrolase [Candidatus Woesearchaeota archaeon]